MKTIFMLLVLTSAVFAQEKVYQLKESDLTEQQKAKLQGGTSVKDVHDWVGLGKEIGTAIDSSLAAISDRTNEFAKTPVGKLTAGVVIWKVVGNDAYHFIGGDD